MEYFTIGCVKYCNFQFYMIINKSRPLQSRRESLPAVLGAAGSAGSNAGLLPCLAWATKAGTANPVLKDTDHLGGITQLRGTVTSKWAIKSYFGFQTQASTGNCLSQGSPLPSGSVLSPVGKGEAAQTKPGRPKPEPDATS